MSKDKTYYKLFGKTREDAYENGKHEGVKQTLKRIIPIFLKKNGEHNYLVGKKVMITYEMLMFARLEEIILILENHYVKR